MTKNEALAKGGAPSKTGAAPKGDAVAASEVRLIGRMGQRSQEVELPSGDVLTRFDIVVDRPRRERAGRTKVDTIACITTTALVAKRVKGVEPGDWVVADGVLRRRFWRAGAGLGSAMEVDIRKLARA